MKGWSISDTSGQEKDVAESPSVKSAPYDDQPTTSVAVAADGSNKGEFS